MTDNNRLITPPPELVTQWWNEAVMDTHFPPYGYSECIATQAARWGADQELEACCEVLRQKGVPAWSMLRSNRRPKPPSLKEQALQALDLLKVDASTHGLGFDSSAIRRALEQLGD
jgi:hypothetical protein